MDVTHSLPWLFNALSYPFDKLRGLLSSFPRKRESRGAVIQSYRFRRSELHNVSL